MAILSECGIRCGLGVTIYVCDKALAWMWLNWAFCVGMICFINVDVYLRVATYYLYVVCSRMKWIVFIVNIGKKGYNSLGKVRYKELIENV